MTSKEVWVDFKHDFRYEVSSLGRLRKKKTNFILKPYLQSNNLTYRYTIYNKVHFLPKIFIEHFPESETAINKLTMPHKEFWKDKKRWTVSKQRKGNIDVI